MMERIKSKEELIKNLAEELDMSNTESWPFVDLTDQTVGMRFDSSIGDPSLVEDLDEHELVDIEPISSREGYEMMEDFARTRNDDECNKIFRAISGHKPFRSFRVCVETLGILNDWYTFKNAAMLKKAEEILSDYDLDFIDGKIVCNNPKNVLTFIYERPNFEDEEDEDTEDNDEEE